MVPKMVPRLGMATVMKSWTLYKILFGGNVVFIQGEKVVRVVHKVVPNGRKLVVLVREGEL